MSRGFGRREFLAGALGLGLAPGAPRAGRSGPPEATGDDWDVVAAWAGRALAAIERLDPAFFAWGDGAACELDTVGRLEVAPSGKAAVRVTLRDGRAAVDIVRTLDLPQVGRVEVRSAEPMAAPAGPGYDTLRRIPGGFELTFTSPLALRHAAPRRVRGELPAVYGRLAAAAVERARPLLG